jgi:hypothetical protein
MPISRLGVPQQRTPKRNMTDFIDPEHQPSSKSPPLGNELTVAIFDILIMAHVRDRAYLENRREVRCFRRGN